MINTLEKFNEVIEDKCYMFFTAPWCSKCKKFKQLATDNGMHIVNVEKIDELSDIYNITKLPTIIHFSDSVEEKRIEEINNEKDIESFLI